MSLESYIKPSWDVPSHVQAVSTTRLNGFSSGQYESFNLGDHVSDVPESVTKNRRKLFEDLNLVNEPVWLKQVHSARVVEAIAANRFSEADASYSFAANQVCVVMTADCLPVLFYNHSNDAVAAAHAGWRGLASGVLLETLKLIGPGKITAWMGAAIGPENFEVGEEVLLAFKELDTRNEKSFLAIDGKPNKWLANIYQLARNQLEAHGVSEISGGEFCTYAQQDLFYSYRRDSQTGRMASLIWKTANPQ